MWEESEAEEDDNERADNEGDSSGENAENQPENVAEETLVEYDGEVRVKRVTRPPSYLRDYDIRNEETSEEDEVNMVEINSSDPTTFEEAEKIMKWKGAMDEEINSIIKNQTWELTNLPKEAKCIGVKWISKIKLNEHGVVNIYKACLVVNGYSQVHDIDYTKVYVLVARMDTVRMLLPQQPRKLGTSTN